jgi:hypothetical protein
MNVPAEGAALDVDLDHVEVPALLRYQEVQDRSGPMW